MKAGYRTPWYLLGLIIILAVGGAHAETRPLKFSSGTGFFISRQGHIVTNAHVVSPCADKNRIYFSGLSYKPRDASLVAMDEDKDLAILRTGFRPNRTASLRWTHTHIQEKERVFLIGYPEARTINSPYVTTTAMIKGIKGPFGEDKWLQFTDAARQGNSGGPLLDFGGNVVGVVTAKSKVMRINRGSAREELVDESDIAVTASVLKEFLDRYRIYYNQNDSLLTLSENRLEQMAKEYVMHIFCTTEEGVELKF